MMISDQNLRRALTERADAVGSESGRAALDIGAMARGVATSSIGGPRVSRHRGLSIGRWVPRFAAVAGSLMIGIALLVGVAIGPIGPRGGSASAEPAPSQSPESASATAPATGLETLGPSASSSMPISGCEAMGFSSSRCAAVVARARVSAEPPSPANEVIAATVGPPPAPQFSLGSFPLAEVRLALVGGGTAQVVVRCGLPGPSDRACNPEARIYIFGGVDHDVPCGAEEGGPDNPCATLPPTARPGSVAAAQPLRVATFDIPLGRTGRYELLVGAASLPDGVLTERSARLVDDTPTTFWIDDGVRIDVRPDDPSRPPIGSIYRDPYDGVEPVHVWLVFDVVDVGPGAVLQVRDLVIR